MMRYGMLLAACGLIVGCAWVESWNTEAAHWKIESGAQGDENAVRRISEHRRDKSNPVDEAVLTDKDNGRNPDADNRHFHWRGATLGSVVDSLGKQVRARNQDAANRLAGARIHTRFGPLEEEVREPLVFTIADMYGVELTDRTTWRWNGLDAWGRGDRIKSWGRPYWQSAEAAAEPATAPVEKSEEKAKAP